MDRLLLLLRLNRQTVDERQSELGNVCRVRAEADLAAATHEQHLSGECEMAATDLDSLAAFGPWASHATRQGMELQKRRSELTRIEAAARDALREAFADTKRLELALETAERAARKIDARKTDLRADEQQMLQRLIMAA